MNLASNNSVHCFSKEYAKDWFAGFWEVAIALWVTTVSLGVMCVSRILARRLESPTLSAQGVIRHLEEVAKEVVIYSFMPYTVCCPPLLWVWEQYGFSKAFSIGAFWALVLPKHTPETVAMDLVACFVIYVVLSSPDDRSWGTVFCCVGVPWFSLACGLEPFGAAICMARWTPRILVTLGYQMSSYEALSMAMGLRVYDALGWVVEYLPYHLRPYFWAEQVPPPIRCEDTFLGCWVW